MVFSQITQPNSSYLTWTKFAYPHAENGPVPAFSVSMELSRYIQSGYTMMSGLIVVNITAIFIASGLWIYLRGSRAGNRVNDISISLWNNREATHMSVIDTLYYSRDALRKWWYYPLVTALLGAWAASVLAGIFLPSKVFLGNAAPVNPTSIYVPPDMRNFTDSTSDQIYFGTFALNVDPYLRAAGAAYIATDDVRSQVMVEKPVSLGSWTGPDPIDAKKQRTEPIQRINYGYNITGARLGLQRLPKLQLRVTGSCVTNYTWFRKTQKGGPYVDAYQSQWKKNGSFDVVGASCAAPSARFKSQPSNIAPDEQGNRSWAIIASSVDRLSYTSSTDPWYRTKALDDDQISRLNLTDSFGMKFIVTPGRPVLSCWQSDLWYWGDEGSQKSSNIVNLQALVGKDLLSDAMVEILQRYFTAPVAYSLGFSLQGSALQSSKTTVGKIFDAGASSMYKDLYYVILSAYIATENTLTDTTLYTNQTTTGGVAKVDLPNLAFDSSGKHPRPGVDDFVVFSNNVVALSLTTAIIIPVLTLGSWLLMHLMLGLTPLKMAAAMESIELFKAVKDHYGEPTVHLTDNGAPKWTL
ncbi:hypothetical protein QBC34DRAFT_354455 [Podospora aff. communis PSN243]|uniref:Uncharacterized protein n=1 Tax=Podospora aff. communis PSN243 TaxID=3040156 RepID=A0AAV9GGD5_9PEZI|nr:hypothetical protein QBC34DRAFT_354455 [Podospora aff. communis PSN243]